MRRAGILVLALGLSVMCVPSTAGAAGDRGRVTAFDAATGTRAWTVTAPEAGGGFDLVAAARSRVFGVLNQCFWDDQGAYQTGDTTLIAWDATTGRELWRVPDVGSGFLSLTEPTGGNVVRGAAARATIPVSSEERNELRGLSLRDGSTQWRYATGGARVVTGDDADLLLARSPYTASGSTQVPSPSPVTLLDARSGRVRWSITLDAGTTAIGSALLPKRVALLLTTSTPFDARAQRIEMLDRATGARLWTRTIDSYALPDSADISPGTALRSMSGAVVVAHATTAIRIDPSNGDELWRLADAFQLTNAFTTAGPPTVIASPPWTNGGSGLGETALDAATGKVRWQGPGRQRILTPGSDVVAEIPANLEHDDASGVIVDVETGAPRWSTTLGDDDSLLARAGTLYRGTGCPVTLRD